MHTITELGNSVPAFLGKLWKLVTDPETDDLICWSTNGKSFFIRNQARFARELLPHYYKHNNMASFVRQLNMYGFHKKVSVELGGLRCDRDEMEFAHQFFIRNQPYLLEHIKRKIASNKAQDPTQAPVKPELMTKVLTEVRNIRGRQEHFDTRLGSMKRENAALWKELAVLRQKHHKQQQIVNKLIHFLVTLVHPNRNSGIAVKRRYPLMIDDKQRVKQRKASKPHTSPAGPAIHELDASDPELDSEYIVAEMLDDQNPMVESPVHHGIVDDSVADETYDDDIINLSDEIIPDNNVNLFKKRSKGKKKGRKNKVPVKIFIPPSENEETPREEIIMLEVPEDNSKSSEDVAPKSTISCLKSIPVAPFKSSKLAAMVANMSNEEIDIDLDSLTEVAEDDSNVKLENVLKNPNIVTEENPAELLLSTIDNSNNEIQYENSNKNLASDLVNGSFSNYNIANSTSQNINNIAEKKESANFNIPKNLSLSCVNSNESERNYRQEVGDHLEITQSQLDNVQDLLKNDNYTFDANTILELFDNSDPMTYSFPVSPDLNPLSNMEKETNLNNETSPVNKRELMAYTNPNLLDYDNIFLGESSSPVTDVTGTVSYDNDPLDYDSKTSLLDSLISNNGSTSHS